MAPRRLAVALIAALAIGSALIRAQSPGQNVNIVSKDPYLQKQNEPSGAISTRNPCHLMAGANDYRTVNIKGLPADAEIGDSWVGLYQSVDCGKTWIAGLMPGFPQDGSTEGTASPVKGLTTAADPTVRAGAAGFFAHSFIAFNRGSNVGKMALATFIDENNREVTAQNLGAGDPLKVPIAQLPIKYLKTIVVDSGSAGQFLDKPSITVTPVPNATCSLNGQSVPASRVHMVWTVFVGNSNNPDNIRTKVYYAQSSNCGQTLDGPAVKLSEGYPINQGGTVAVTPSGKIFVAWRQFEQDFSSSEILVSTSTDGKLFTKAMPVDNLAPYTFFDQSSGPVTFRTTAFPTLAADHNNRVHLAISVRSPTTEQGNTLTADARIVHLSSTDGLQWTMPKVVDPDPSAGHQFMPAITYGSGVLQLIWYDLRDDFSDVFEFTVNEAHALQLAPNKRHTLDVRGARGVITEPPPTNNSSAVVFATYGVLQLAGQTPRTSQYLLGGKHSNTVKQLQFNRPNLKLYGGGTLPFIGDYIDIAALMYVPGSSGFVLNAPATAGAFSQDIHAFWTDNRDANVDVKGTVNPDLDYTAPIGGATCNAALTKNRNANVYTARISQDLLLSIPGNAKKGSNGIQRAYAVLLENTTFDKEDKHVTLRISSGTNFASFVNGSPMTQIPVDVGARSSAARTVFVTSPANNPNPRIQVDALVSGTVIASALINPDGTNPAIGGNGLDTAELHNPDIENPDIENPDIENPDIENPDIENPDIENPDIENPDIENPDIENPDIENPDIENPDIENPDIENPDIENGAVTDSSVEVVNNGNTTTAYQVDVNVDGDTSGYVFQLIGTRLYKLPGSKNCAPAVVGQNQVVFNIINPILQPGAVPDVNDPSVTNATVLLAPGERIKVTLRAWDKDSVYLTGTTTHPPGGNGVTAPFCTMIGGLCQTATNTMTVLVKAEPANTGETEPRSISTVADLVFQGPLTATPSPVTVGDTINVSGVTLRNDGQLPASGVGGFEYTYYLSTDNIINTEDIRLRTVDGVGPIPAEGTLSISPTTLTIPSSVFESPLPAGNYYVGILVDEQQDVVEGNEGNNAIVTATPITVHRLGITTTAVPGAIVGSPYGPKTLQQVNGVAPLTWSVQSGSLPAGISLNTSTGTLSGTATTPGTSAFTIAVQDSTGELVTRAFSITTMTIGAGDLIIGDGVPATTTGRLFRVTPAGAAQLIASIPGMPRQVVQDGSSFVVVDATNNSVLRVTPGNVETLYTSPTPAGFFAVAVTNGGDIIIGDNFADKLYKLSGGTLTTIANLPSSVSERQDVDIVVEPSGDVIAADDTFTGPVQLVRVAPAGVSTVTTTVASAGAIAIGPGGNFILADYNNAQLVTVNATTGAFISARSLAGIGTPLTGLSVDLDGGMYLLSGNIAVRRVPVAGAFTTVPTTGFTFMTDLVQFRPLIITTGGLLAPAVFDSGPGTGGGRAYRQVLAAAGISGTPTWSLGSCASCTGLPFGLSLSSAGIVSGTPDAHVPPATPPPPDAAERTNYTFTARITDSSGSVAARTFTLPIHDYWENMTVSATSCAVVNSAFNTTVNVRDNSNGVVPGVLVHLQITNNVGGATQFDLTALTNAVGDATFSPKIDQPGSGYTLVAWVPQSTITLGNSSGPITITSGSCPIILH